MDFLINSLTAVLLVSIFNSFEAGIADAIAASNE